YFYLKDDRVARAVDAVSFSIGQGETVASVGEPGTGKSMTAVSIMRLINKPEETVSDDILIEDKPLLESSARKMSQIRCNDIWMIFQEPMTAVNPVFSIGNQLIEMIVKHKGASKRKAKKRAIELLEIVGIARPKQIMTSYPPQLSGAMRQRVMIAIAISCESKLLIEDERTTYLDVTIQVQV